MKIRLLALFAVAVLMCMPVFAQSSDTSGSSDTTKQDSTSQDTTKQDSSSQDSMKHDDMKQDSTSQDSMKHDDMKQDTMAKGSAKAGKAKLRRLTGTVGADGTTFVNDKDQKSWTVMNPEVFKGHEGHHVRIRAHVYPDKDSIHVMSLKMAKAKAAKATDTTKP